jgi:hypothetical protein
MLLLTAVVALLALIITSCRSPHLCLRGSCGALGASLKPLERWASLKPLDLVSGSKKGSAGEGCDSLRRPTGLTGRWPDG